MPILILIASLILLPSAFAENAGWDPFYNYKTQGETKPVEKSGPPAKNVNSKTLFPGQIERLKRAKELLKEMDQSSLQDAIAEMEKSDNPEEDLEYLA